MVASAGEKYGNMLAECKWEAAAAPAVPVGDGDWQAPVLVTET